MARRKPPPRHSSKSRRNRKRRPSTAPLAGTEHFGAADATTPETLNGTTYAVGYGKPPKAGQFRKGMSGNRKGRPKGAKNFATLLDEALNEEVTIVEDGLPRTVSKLELIFKQLVDQGAGGNLRAVGMIAKRVDAAQNRAASEPADVLDEADQEAAQALIKRIRNAPEEPSND